MDERNGMDMKRKFLYSTEPHTSRIVSSTHSFEVYIEKFQISHSSIAIQICTLPKIPFALSSSRSNRSSTPTYPKSP